MRYNETVISIRRDKGRELLLEPDPLLLRHL